MLYFVTATTILVIHSIFSLSLKTINEIEWKPRDCKSCAFFRMKSKWHHVHNVVQCDTTRMLMTHMKFHQVNVKRGKVPISDLKLILTSIVELNDNGRHSQQTAKTKKKSNNIEYIKTMTLWYDYRKGDEFDSICCSKFQCAMAHLDMHPCWWHD